MPRFSFGHVRISRGWFWTGTVLVIIHGILLVISSRFRSGLRLSDRPFLTLVALLMLAGAVYLFAVFRLNRSAAPTGVWWAWIGSVGLFMRVLMLPSTPVLDTDKYRYLWDGGVLAHGYNPYSYSPRVDWREPEG